MGEAFEGVQRRVQQAPTDPEEASQLLRDIARLAVAVDRAALFSSGEVVEDIPTSSLKFLLVDLFQSRALSALASSAARDPPRRHRLLTQSNAALTRFVARCVDLDVAHPDDAAVFAAEEAPKGAAVREMKMARARRQRDAKQRMAHLEALLHAAAGEEDKEEETRDFMLLQLQSGVRDALDELAVTSQELEILAHMMERMEADPTLAEQRPPDGPWAPPPGVPLAEDPRRPGLNVTHIVKGADGGLQRTRETIKAEVFKPRMAPPTMTIEELADIEIAEAKAREEASKKLSEDERPVRSVRQLEEAGLEDDAALLEASEGRDRDWDNWKDHNPRGWGNRGNKKRFGV